MFTLPDRDTETKTDTITTVGIRDDVCVYAVWTPPHNSIQSLQFLMGICDHVCLCAQFRTILYNPLFYRSRCLCQCQAVWTHHYAILVSTNAGVSMYTVSCWHLFGFFTNYTKMPILTFSSLLHKNKQIQWQNVTPSGNRTQAASDFKSNTILSTLTWHLLLRRSLNFCSCTTWYLDLNDLMRINRAWLYKDPKVSVLQANVILV